jgi:Uma2 family endonuclease
VFRLLFVLLGYYLSRRGGGILRGSRYPMRLDPSWSPEPDLLVVREERRTLMTRTRLEGPADLVVEIVSEADTHIVYREKLPRYREAGIPEIWIVDPLREHVLVDRVAAGSRESRTAKDGRIDSVIIPGFWIDAGWLFRPELPPPHACLDEILGRSA